MSSSVAAETIEPCRPPCVCASLRMATRAVARIFDGALAPHGLRTSQYSILVRLEVEGPASVSALAARLAMDRTTLSRELAPLVERGFVTVEPGQDRRQRIVSATEAGVALRVASYPAWRAAQAEVRELFGDARSRALVGELHELVAATAA